MKNYAGATLVELVICLVLLMGLVAVSLPNYHQGQISSQVAQAKADLQALKTGLEAYKVDREAYPRMNLYYSCLVPVGRAYDGAMQPTLERLTTPISYLNNMAPFYDPFEATASWSGANLITLNVNQTEAEIDAGKQYFYTARHLYDNSIWQTGDGGDPFWYLLESAGPDKTHYRIGARLNSMTTDSGLSRAISAAIMYDPTNGTISKGSIWTVGGEPQGRGVSMAYVITEANSTRINDWQEY